MEAASVAAAGLGALAKIIGDISTSAVRAFGSRLARRRAVYDAFNNPSAPTLPKHLTTAFRDIEITIGSRAGILTSPLAQFFEELRNTDLPVSMIQGRLLRVKSPGVAAAFRELFLSHFPSGIFEAGDTKFTADQLFDTLQAAFATSVFHQDIAIQKIFFSEVSLRNEREEFFTHDNHLLDIFEPRSADDPDVRRPAPWLKDRPQQPRQLMMKLAQSLLPSFATISVEGPDRHHRRVSLEDIFVAAPIVPDQAGESASPVKYADLLALHQRAVIVGDPGGGKSTHGQKLCQEILGKCASGEGRLAVRVEMRRYEAALANEPQLSLIVYLAREVRRSANSVDESELIRALVYFMSFGLVFLFF